MLMLRCSDGDGLGIWRHAAGALRLVSLPSAIPAGAVGGHWDGGELLVLGIAVLRDAGRGQI